MKRCLIIAGGDYAPIEPEEGDYILACDKGYAWCKREGIVPDLILGDFDSYGGKLPEGVPVLRFPIEKDDTDTMLAVRWSSEQGFNAVRLSGRENISAHPSVRQLYASVPRGAEPFPDCSDRAGQRADHPGGKV